MAARDGDLVVQRRIGAIRAVAPASGPLCGFPRRHRRREPIRQRAPRLNVGSRLIAFAAGSDSTTHALEFLHSKPTDHDEGRALSGLGFRERHFSGRILGSGARGGIGAEPGRDDGSGVTGCGEGRECGLTVIGMGAGLRGMGFDPGPG